ncbi:MAG: PilZ domain-containing protein [Oligoflexia bacterium]|nr:PilZ domain-containing protein [Oligoflexia bacterium]
MSRGKAYFKNLPNNEKVSLLKNAIRTHSEVQIWKKGSKNIEKFRIIDLEGDSRIILDLIDMHTRYLNFEILLNFIYDNSQYFTTCILQINQNQEYYVDISNDLFKCEKRNSFRLKANQYNSISLIINEKTYSVQDISTGGLSLIVEEAEEEIYKKNKQFLRCILELNKIIYTIPLCEIVNIIPNKAHKTFKLGIKFLNLSQEDESKLCRQINNDVFLNKKLNRAA